MSLPSDLIITPRLSLPLAELDFSATRAQGAGGQHVNKTESAVQLRFDVTASTLPEAVKERLLARRDQRISVEGVVLIKAQQFRSQERNREAALERLRLMIAAAATEPVLRKATRPTKSAKRQRVDDKVRQGRVKALRSRPQD